MSTLRANTLKPITSGNSLVLQGDSGGSGVSGPSIDSNGDVDFSQNTNAKIKLPSAGGIYESDGSTQILTESGGSVTIENATFNGTIGSSATLASSLFNKSINGYVILPSGIEIKWGSTSTISSFANSASHTHTYTSDQGGAFGNATLWGIVWIGDRTQGVLANGGTGGNINVDDSASSITFTGNAHVGNTGSDIKYLFLAIGH